MLVNYTTTVHTIYPTLTVTANGHTLAACQRELQKVPFAQRANILSKLNARIREAKNKALNQGLACTEYLPDHKKHTIKIIDNI